ncbi:MAG: CCR4-NOT transcription complex subunit 6-like [Marteilia pararefringens]
MADSKTLVLDSGGGGATNTNNAAAATVSEDELLNAKAFVVAAAAAAPQDPEDGDDNNNTEDKGGGADHPSQIEDEKQSADKHRAGTAAMVLPNSNATGNQSNAPDSASSTIGLVPDRLEIVGNVRNLCSRLFLMQNLVYLNIRCNSINSLSNEICKLTNLKTLNASNNNLSLLPDTIGLMTNLRSLNVSNNRLTYLPPSIGKLFLLKKLKLTGNNFVDRELKAMVTKKEDNTFSIIQYMLHNYPEKLTSLPPRKFRHIDFIPETNFQQQLRFTILSFNILSDRYCTAANYPYCPKWARSWDYRKKIIMSQIEIANADIVALQEVETKQFHVFFFPEFGKLGYAGLFFPKTRSKTMSEDEKLYVDGCALFFKLDKFILIKDYVIEFNKSLSRFSNNCDAIFNRVMLKDNIALAAMLKINPLYLKKLSSQNYSQFNDNFGFLLVVNGHIHWDPEFSDVKLIQTAILLYSVQQIIHQFCVEHNIDRNLHPIASCLCGDFNSTLSSSVVEFITTGLMDVDSPEFQNFDYDGCLSLFLKKIIVNEKLKYMNELPLQNSHLLLNNKHVLKYTNFTYFFKDVIDYIFYDSNSLKPTTILGDLDYNWFKENQQSGMPNAFFPSDHIPLLVEFEWLHGSNIGLDETMNGNANANHNINNNYVTNNSPFPQL